MATISIRDITSKTVHDLPADTRCIDRHGYTVTVADLGVGDLAAVESDDAADGEDHAPDANGDAVRDGHIWWCSERVS
jgi:hypothetical protein